MTFGLICRMQPAKDREWKKEFSLFNTAIVYYSISWQEFSAKEDIMENRREVVVTDIRMPFLSMVIFMIKWAFAAIPAFIIVWIIFAALSLIFSGLMTGFMGSMYHHT